MTSVTRIDSEQSMEINPVERVIPKEQQFWTSSSSSFYKWQPPSWMNPMQQLQSNKPGQPGDEPILAPRTLIKPPPISQPPLVQPVRLPPAYTGELRPSEQVPGPVAAPDKKESVDLSTFFDKLHQKAVDFNDQNPWVLVTYFIGFWIAFALSWKCNTMYGWNIVLRLIFSICAACSSWNYLLFYFIFRYEICGPLATQFMEKATQNVASAVGL